MFMKMFRVSFSLFLILFCIFTIFQVIHLAYHSWPVSDDISIASQMQNYDSMLKYSWNYYKTWDGRLLNNLIYPLLLSDLLSQNIGVMIHALALVLSAVLLAFIWQRYAFPGTLKHLPYSFLLILCTMWLGLTPIIDETVYWASGGVDYILYFFFLVAWLSIMIYLFNTITPLIYLYITLPILLLWSFLVGTGNQATFPAVVFLTTYYMLIFKNRSINRKYALSALIFFIAGAVFMYIAPGNFRRAHCAKSSFIWDIPHMWSQYVIILRLFISKSKYLLPLSAITSLIGSIYVCLQNKELYTFDNVSDYFNARKKLLITSLIFIIAAFIYIGPFTLVPHFASPRTGFFFMLFIMIGLWFLMAFITPLILNHTPKKLILVTAIIAYVFPFVLAGLLNKHIMQDISLARNVRKQMVERHEALSKGDDYPYRRGPLVVVRKIRGDIPKSIHFRDISSKNPGDWINKAVARYYGFKAVIREK